MHEERLRRVRRLVELGSHDSRYRQRSHSFDEGILKANLKQRWRSAKSLLIMYSSLLILLTVFVHRQS